MEFSFQSSPFQRLVGLQKKIVLELVRLSDLVNGHAISQTVTFSQLAEKTGSTAESVKKTVAHLKTLGLLSVAERRQGRGGWLRFQVDGRVYEEANRASIVTVSDSTDIQTPPSLEHSESIQIYQKTARRMSDLKSLKDIEYERYLKALTDADKKTLFSSVGVELTDEQKIDLIQKEFTKTVWPKLMSDASELFEDESVALGRQMDELFGGN